MMNSPDLSLWFLLDEQPSGVYSLLDNFPKINPGRDSLKATDNHGAVWRPAALAIRAPLRLSFSCAGIPARNEY